MATESIVPRGGATRRREPAATHFSLPLSCPELFESLPPEELALARRACVARALRIHRGRWDPSRDDRLQPPPALGLLVVEGLLERETRVGQRWASDLVGPGELIRPWQFFESDGCPLEVTTRWSALAAVDAAVLDDLLLARLCRWPRVVASLQAEAVTGTRRLTTLLALTHEGRAEKRLLLLLWHLADRFGTVTAAGVHLPIRLTHEQLGRMAGAQRSTVTLALQLLRQEGLISTGSGGWLLLGDPPTGDVLLDRAA